MQIGRTTVGDNGSWSFTPAALDARNLYHYRHGNRYSGHISPIFRPVTFTLDNHCARQSRSYHFAEDNVGEVQMYYCQRRNH